MSHIDGQADRDLHHEDDSHRMTPASANGRIIQLHEERLRRHLESHEFDAHAEQALEVANNGGT